MSQGGVLLHGQVRVALVEEDVVANQLGLAKAFVHIAELERDLLVDVAAFAILMDTGLGGRQRFSNRRDGVKRFVVDLYQVCRLKSRVFIDRGNGCDRIADKAHLVDAERMLVLAYWQDTV